MGRTPPLRLEEATLQDSVISKLPRKMRLQLLLLLPILHVAMCIQELRWAEAAWKVVQKECPHCGVPNHKYNVRLYIARPSKLGKMKAITADGSSRYSGYHDSVLVIDPTPHLRMGHLMYLFFVDFNSTRSECEADSGIFLNGDCLTHWKRPHCHRRMNSKAGSCPILFPPEVRAKNSKVDLLECSNHWKPCPKKRQPGELYDCDPYATNFKGCDQSLITPCLFMRICHHAVLLSGGWNNQLSDEESFYNVRTINSMLKRNNYEALNIQTFYGNGLSRDEKVLYSEELGFVYPSKFKFDISHHLKSLCEVKYCSNILFLYLNSPTRPDGTSLLWDASENGELDDGEVYTIDEFFHDINNCKSHRIVIVADQAFSSPMIKMLNKKAANFKNTVLFSPGQEDNRRSLVAIFGNLTPWQCLSDLGPSWVGQMGANFTITGGSCDDENRKVPVGCQSLSTLEKFESEEVIL